MAVVVHEGNHLLYLPAGKAGLGHFLTSISGYASYAEATGRGFQVDAKRWKSFLGGAGPDEVDPFFRTYFEPGAFAENGVDLAGSGVAALTQASIENGWETLIVVSESTDVEEFRKKRFVRDFAENATFMGIKEFRDDYYEPNRDHPAGLIVVVVVEPTKGGRRLERLRATPRIGALNRSAAYPDLEGIDLAKHVGVHVRHGNGEYLFGRIEGNDEAFDRYLATIAARAQTLARDEDLGVIAVGDNEECLDRLRDHGIRTLASTHLPDRAWFDHLQSQADQERSLVIMKALQDFFLLANCRHVVCGYSLFATAAYLFSDHRSFEWIEPAPAA